MLSKVKTVLLIVAKRILPWCGVFGVGLALWLAAKRNPDYFPGYSEVVRRIGDVDPPDLLVQKK